MSKQKYAEANILTFEKLGLPDFVKDQIIVSSKEMEIASKCILLLRMRIKRLCIPQNEAVDADGYKPSNPVWIPYQEYLGRSFPAMKGTDMRSAKYFASILSVVALTKSNFLLDSGGSTMAAIARSDDLIETLTIAQNLVKGDYSGIPVHKIKFFEGIFVKAYTTKEGPDEKDGKIEPVKGLTTREMSDYYKKVTGKSISPDNLKKQFLDELEANDIIGEVKSEIDGRRLLFYPLITSMPMEEHEKITKLSNEPTFENISYIPAIELSKVCKYIPQNWLILEIISLAKYRIDFDRAIGPFADYLNNSEELKFLQTDITLGAGSSKRLSIRDFISKYECPSSISI